MFEGEYPANSADVESDIRGQLEGFLKPCIGQDQAELAPGIQNHMGFLHEILQGQGELKFGDFYFINGTHTALIRGIAPLLPAIDLP